MTELAPASSAPHLGDIRQLGYVVEDLDAAIEAWQKHLRVGPWLVMRNIELNCVYRGQQSAPLIDIALSYRGDQQIELIQQRNDAASPYLEFVRKRQFGLHHTAYLSEEIDRDITALEQSGMDMVCDIRMPGPGGGRYAYFASPVPGEGTFIELLEATLLMKTMFADGMAEAKNWQGEGRPVVIDLGPMLAVLRVFKRLFGLFSKRN